MSSTHEENTVQVDVDRRGVATVRLSRPHVNNAYNGDMINALIDAVEVARTSDDVRVVVIRGEGRHFQAGADLKWIQSVKAGSREQNHHVSRRTALAIRNLNELKKPVVALVHGGCFGGGVGMLCACDIVIASRDAIFSITETRWGLTAAIIVPQLNAAIGARQARRYALSGERFGADQARDLGLVHEVCEVGELDTAAEPVVDALLHIAPGALAQCKEDILRLGDHAVDDRQLDALVSSHAAARQTAEATEGLASFVEKRKPAWYTGG